MGLFGRLVDDLVNTFVSILKGHQITWRNLWRERVTLQYPNERPKLPERYRGLPGLHPELCIVCGACAKACPVQVINIQGRKIAGTRHRELVRYQLEAGRCMFCGLCEEACPTKPVKAIRLSNTFELAVADKSALVLEIPQLLEIWKSKPVEVPEEQYLAATPKKLAAQELAKQAEGEKPKAEGAEAAPRPKRVAAEGGPAGG